MDDNAVYQPQLEVTSSAYYVAVRRQKLLTEITCGPISEPLIVDEIPFVCALFLEGGSTDVSVQYGLVCNLEIDALWQPKTITASQLSDWIARSVEDGIYQPGRSDIIIEDPRRLKIKLCHEADIHIETQIAAIIEKCASRWLRKGYRIMRSDEVPPSQRSWREVHSVRDATTGL